MFNDPQIQSTFDPQEIQSYKVVAVLSYIIPILFFLPVVMTQTLPTASTTPTKAFAGSSPA